MDSNISVQKKHLDAPRSDKTIKTHKGGTNPNEISSDDSDIEPDLVSTIKHNTITSMAALKDVLHSNGNEKPYEANNGTFFQHYFQNHSGSLPSRNVVTYRRLSQCREEDEEEDKHHNKEHVPSELATISGSDKSLSESSSSGSKSSVIDTVTGPTHKFVVTKTKQIIEPPIEVEKVAEVVKKEPSEAAKIFARRKYIQSNTVNDPTTGPRRPSIYSIFSKTSPHYDSRYFDSSLIEMKSQTSSASTLDSGSTEDIWVRRTAAEVKRELGSQPLPTFHDDGDVQAIPRPRSGTWGAKDSKKESKHKKDKSKDKTDSKDKEKKDKKDKKEKDKQSRSGSASRSNSAERRKSIDDIQSPKKTGMLDAFRSRSHSDASKKKGMALMATMKSAMLHTGLMHGRPKAARDGSAHPVRDGSSDTQYYHTVTAASSSRSPMTKVMDIFRNRSHQSVPPEDRRKRAAQQQLAQGRFLFNSTILVALYIHFLSSVLVRVKGNTGILRATMFL